jgi:hypothetical protein
MKVLYCSPKIYRWTKFIRRSNIKNSSQNIEKYALTLFLEKNEKNYFSFYFGPAIPVAQTSRRRSIIRQPKTRAHAAGLSRAWPSALRGPCAPERPSRAQTGSAKHGPRPFPARARQRSCAEAATWACAGIPASDSCPPGLKAGPADHNRSSPSDSQEWFSVEQKPPAAPVIPKP